MSSSQEGALPCQGALAFRGQAAAAVALRTLLACECTQPPLSTWCSLWASGGWREEVGIYTQTSLSLLWGPPLTQSVYLRSKGRYTAGVRGSETQEGSAAQKHSLVAIAPGRPFCSLGEEQVGDGGLGRWGQRSHTRKKGQKEARCSECLSLLPNFSVWAHMFPAGAREVVEVGSERERELEAHWVRNLETWPCGKRTGDSGCHFSSPCLPITSGQLARCWDSASTLSQFLPSAKI